MGLTGVRNGSSWPAASRRRRRISCAVSGFCGAPVVRRDDLLACGGLQVRTPVGHNAIGAIGRVPLAAIADDGVVGDSPLASGKVSMASKTGDPDLRKRMLFAGSVKSPRSASDGFDKDPPVSPIDGPRHLMKRIAAADQGIVRNRAAAMRSRHIDYSGDVPPAVRIHHVCDHAPRLGAEVELFEGVSESAAQKAISPARGQ